MGVAQKVVQKCIFFQKTAVQMYCWDPANFTKINILLDPTQSCCSKMLEILKTHKETIGGSWPNLAQFCSRLFKNARNTKKKVLVRPGPILLKSNSELFKNNSKLPKSSSKMSKRTQKRSKRIQKVLKTAHATKGVLVGPGQSCSKLLKSVEKSEKCEKK